MKRMMTAFLILAAAGGAYAQEAPETEAANEAPDAIESAPDEARRVVARFRDREVTWADLEPDPRMVEANRKAFDAENFAQWMESARTGRLTEIIFGGLLGEYRAARDLDPTDTEIEEFIEGSERMEAESRREFRERAAAIPKQLENTALPEAEKKRLNEELAMLERLLKTQEETEAQMRQQWGEDWPRIQRESKARVARHMVGAWKVNRALFDEFGGRVIFQQAGPEPVDAYRDFLRQRETEGAFEILDEGLRDDFWRYFVNDQMHVFYDAEEGARWMATPWWKLPGPREEPAP